MLNSKVENIKSLNDVVNTSKSGSPLRFSHIPSVRDLTSEAINCASIDDLQNGEGTGAPISRRNVPACAALDYSYDLSDSATESQNFKLSLDHNQPALAMGPGGPVWVTPNGDPLGKRALYPNVTHAGEIPYLLATDINGGKAERVHN